MASKGTIKNTLKLDLDRRQVWSFFCPLCAVSRRITGSAQPGQPMHYVQVGLCALMFTLATFKWFQFKGMVSFLPMWIIFEVAYRTRVRARVRCPDCGFDPVLCLSDVDRARKEVEDHWKRKFAEKGIPFPDKNPDQNPVKKQADQQDRPAPPNQP